MTARRIIVHATAVVLMAAGIASAQKGKCNDVPIEVAVVPMTGGALVDDGKGPYQEGVGGVYNTVIHTCGTSASYDATMGLITSRRSLGFTFPLPIDGSVYPGPAPVWAGSSFFAKPFMNVRRILWGRMQDPQQLTFTTRMVFSYFSGPGDKASYALQFAPTVTDSGATGGQDANYPSETTPATVEDVLGTCHIVTGGTLDKWIVTVGAGSVGALMRDTNKGPALVQSGQYTMAPFQLIITAKSCVPDVR
jgi:hypothetical protein